MDLVYFLPLLTMNKDNYSVPLLSINLSSNLCGLRKEPQLTTLRTLSWDWIHAITEHHSTDNVIAGKYYNLFEAEKHYAASRLSNLSTPCQTYSHTPIISS